MAIVGRIPVLIVGAGPTGLRLAAQLARRGVRAAIVDRHAGPSRETKALFGQAAADADGGQGDLVRVHRVPDEPGNDRTLDALVSQSRRSTCSARTVRSAWPGHASIAPP